MTKVVYCNFCNMATNHIVDEVANYTRETCEVCHNFTTKNRPPDPKSNTTWTISNMLNPSEWKVEEKK